MADDKATDAILRSMKEQLVNMANSNNDLMDGTMAPIERILAENEMVVAVWQDRTATDGVGMMIVKGQSILLDCIAKNAPINVTMSAIKCVDEEQAHALIQVKSERDRRH